jgi:hypothetical protein
MDVAEDAAQARPIRWVRLQLSYVDITPVMAGCVASALLDAQ